MTVVRRVFVLVFVLFVDTLRAASAASARLEDPAAGLNARISLMRAQRNSYLCGTTLFLLLVLYAFQNVLKELFVAEKKNAAARPRRKKTPSCRLGGKRVGRISRWGYLVWNSGDESSRPTAWVA